MDYGGLRLIFLFNVDVCSTTKNFTPSRDSVTTAAILLHRGMPQDAVVVCRFNRNESRSISSMIFIHSDIYPQHSYQVCRWTATKLLVENLLYLAMLNEVYLFLFNFRLLRHILSL